MLFARRGGPTSRSPHQFCEISALCHLGIFSVPELHPTSHDVAIIGAGPYGLSIAAHLRARQIEHLIIGDPMRFWLRNMPKDMLLKSDGFSSTLYDPGSSFTLRHYCEERKIEYADLGTPVRIEDFCAYGLAFQQRFAPNLVNNKLTWLERIRNGFSLHLSDGDSFTARRVVIATGLNSFGPDIGDQSMWWPQSVSFLQQSDGARVL
jgi:thioredoxin reductase